MSLGEERYEKYWTDEKPAAPDACVTGAAWSDYDIYILQCFEDAAETADAAREQPVIIMLQSEEENQRILDFLTGAAYAMQGAIYRVSSRVYLIAPEGVEVTA